MSPDELKAAEDQILADMAAMRAPIKLTDNNDAVLLSWDAEAGTGKVRVGAEHRIIIKSEIKGARFP